MFQYSTGRYTSESVKRISEMSYSEFLRIFFFSKTMVLGNYLDYMEYMWSVRHEPNILLLYYEEVVRVRPLLILLTMARVLVCVSV